MIRQFASVCFGFMLSVSALCQVHHMAGPRGASVQNSGSKLRPVVKTIELPRRLKLSYVEQGDLTGIPVVFLHGYTDSWRSFELVLPYLPKTIHAFVLSQRGHGDTDRPETAYRPEDFSADAAAFLYALKIKQAVIVGHSMGSYVAQRFAMDYPERTRGLVLIASFLTIKGNSGVDELWNSTISKLVDPIDPNFIRAFQQSTLNKPIPHEFLNAVVEESSKVPARIWQAALKNLMETDFSGELGKIQAPTLIVWGDQDSFFPRRDQQILAAKIRGARLLVYAGVGHGLHWEEPRRFAADLVSFTNRLASSKRKQQR